jgi:uncharacterized delta-60 repeat protein
MFRLSSRFCGSFSDSAVIVNLLGRFGTTVGVLLVCVVIGVIVVLAADGDLDRSFGFQGKEMIQIADDVRDFANAILVQPDGKILIGGELGDYGSDYNSSVLVRINPDGSLDPTFGSGGKVVNAGQLHLPSMVLQPDGKILTAGATSRIEISLDFAVVRYNADGSLDQTFGNGGYAINGVGNAHDVVLQPDGKILLIGHLPVFRNGSDFLVARFNADGTADTTFGNGGRVTTSFTSGLNSSDVAKDGALQPDGKLIVVGSISGTPAVLVRYNTNGTVDTSFGLEGFVLSTNFAASARQVLIQPDGKIVVSGGAFVIARYLADGHLDQTFGTGGRSAGGFGTGIGNLNSMTRQTDGKILIAGIVSWSNTGNSAFAIGRYNTNGTLDPAWGNGGFVLTEFTGALDEANGIAVQSDGRVLSAGYAAEPGATYVDFAVARYLSTSGAVATRRVPFDFDGDGKSDVSIFRPSAGEWWYSRSSNGSVGAGQFGASSDAMVASDFTGDGRTDLAVWRPNTGEWFVLRSENNSYFALRFGMIGDIAAPADYDGDGRADAAVYRPSTGVWYILQSSDGQVALQRFGSAGDEPVTADYDGDNRSDIAIYRPSTGEWWLLQSSAGVAVRRFGSSEDRTVQGDFTGDGKADVAVWRPSNGTWYVLRSEDRSYFAFPFGMNGDMPLCGDFDGDGKFDAGVFRPSDSNWYVNRSSAGTMITRFGMSSDLPVPGEFVR